MGAMLILMMGFLIGSLIIQLIKSLKDIITLVAKAFAFLIEIFFCQIPKLIKKGFLLLKMKYRSMRLRY